MTFLPSRRRRAAVRIAVLLCLSLVLASPALAADQTAARKFGRGLAAMTTGFLEVPGNMVQTTRERGLGWGLSLGFAVGLGKLVPRHLVGVYETVTAPFPLPAGFQPILRPEFPWGYFDEPPRRP